MKYKSSFKVIYAKEAKLNARFLNHISYEKVHLRFKG
jgi:hypothetical protein